MNLLTLPLTPGRNLMSKALDPHSALKIYASEDQCTALVLVFDLFNSLGSPHLVFSVFSNLSVSEIMYETIGSPDIFLIVVGSYSSNQKAMVPPRNFCRLALPAMVVMVRASRYPNNSPSKTILKYSYGIPVLTTRRSRGLFFPWSCHELIGLDVSSDFPSQEPSLAMAGRDGENATHTTKEESWKAPGDRWITSSNLRSKMYTSTLSWIDKNEMKG